jgi:hypothetical protein
MKTIRPILLLLVLIGFARADEKAEQIKKEIQLLTPVGTASSKVLDIIKSQKLVFCGRGASCVGGKEFFYTAKTGEDESAYWITWVFFDNDKVSSIHVNEPYRKEPNQSPETTTMAVTPAASHPARQP